ncbi:MAG: type I methionyl aminopeptidase [Spirochaetaceae bacterium]|nr:MAG: type I methionyl aminopeptidase [Spirochaetaceae bacterium]
MPARTSLEIVRLAKPAAYLGYLFRELKHIMVPGVCSAEIDAFCRHFLSERRMEPILEGYRGFPAAVCVSVNSVAVHGIPGSRTLENGDVVTVDVGAGYAGWKADAAWTYAIGTPTADGRRLIRAAWRSCCAGMRACRPGSRVGDIGAAVQEAAISLGCSVVSQFLGHGIGREVHEPPAVPHVGTRGTGDRLQAGMVLNVEPVVTLGRPHVTLLDDGWSYVTSDGACAAQYELTVALFAASTRVLTVPELDLSDPGLDDWPPFC